MPGTFRLGKRGRIPHVGAAVAKNPVALLVPCHRVINTTGRLYHYCRGATRKKAMAGWEAAHRAAESWVSGSLLSLCPGSVDPSRHARFVRHRTLTRSWARQRMLVHELPYDIAGGVQGQGGSRVQVDQDCLRSVDLPRDDSGICQGFCRSIQESPPRPVASDFYCRRRAES